MSRSDPPAAPFHALVVDDDPALQGLFSRLLSRKGFSVDAAADGRLAYDQLNRHAYSVILLDLMMPDMDGFQVVRELRANPVTAEIPVIMITARDDLDARAEGMRLGVSDFLAKPVFRRQLASRVRAQLEVVETARNATAAMDRLDAVKKRSQ